MELDPHVSPSPADNNIATSGSESVGALTTMLT